MKMTTPYISEEHIVAWLDQELVADNDFRSSIEQTPALKTAASEYAAISEAIVRSKSDKRFGLSPSVDSRVRASLQQELSRNRKTVRTPERAPNAQPIPNTSTPDRSKRILVRRTSYALAFALLLCAVWFGLPTQNQPTTASNVVSQQTPVAQAPVNISNVEPTPTVSVANNNMTAVVESPVTSAPIKHNSNRSVASNVAQHPVEPTSQQNQPTTLPIASTTEQADPAGMMISHRFAKLVKATPAVVVNQQDRM